MLFAHDATNTLMEPALQYGAFGLCVLLCGVIVMLIKASNTQGKAVLEVLAETSRVITLNTTTIETVGDSVARHDAAAAKRHDDARAEFRALHDVVIGKLAVKEAT